MSTVEQQLHEWARAQIPAATGIEDVAPMPGHAGLSFGFTVLEPSRRERFVIRLAPPGVRRSGNTDVLRQVPVLQAMDAAGVPVAPVVWSTCDPAWFGTDAYVQRFVAGRPLQQNDGVWRPGSGDPKPFLANQIAALAAIHAVDWQHSLADWEQPRDPSAEIEHWRRLQPKMAEEHTREIADQLACQLRASIPRDGKVGVFHGDFHPMNVLFFDDATVSAVVDWEICGIGMQGLDIAWLSMMLDERCWTLSHGRGLQGSVDPAWLLQTYESASGAKLPDAAWYKAYACYRFGVITGFNLRLHRTGKRPDPHWEEIGPSADALLRRGIHLIEHPQDF